MKNLVKQFCLRGLIFGGWGPLVYSIVMVILYACKVDTNIDGFIAFKAILTTYLMAFIIAGASIIWQVEKVGLAVAILIHCASLYFCYLITYLVNGWLKTDWSIIGLFTLIFVVGYLFIWVIIYLIERKNAKNLNMRLK